MALKNAPAGFVRLHFRVLGVLMLAGFVLDGVPGHTQVQSAADNVRLTLSSQTVWQGDDGWFAFSAEIPQGKGGISYRCGRTGPFGTASPGAGGGGVRRRALTDSETATLRKLYEAARLFDGDHVGADNSAGDLPFLILIVRTLSRDRRSAVLVVTGNPSFSSGPRRALFDWLIRERQAMLRLKPAA